MGDIKVGQTIQTQDGRQGVVRFAGPTAFAKGTWVGLELPDEGGKNDGSVGNERYFQCAPGFGIFVRPESIEKIVKQPPPAINGRAPNKTTSSTTRGLRPSSDITPEIARKRQSLMSAASTASRLSARSPTKPLAKPTTSSASSAASTPRTGTPATTTRTSDSSAKSRTSIAGRPSTGPTTTVRSTIKPLPPRPSVGGATSKTTRSTGVRQSLLGHQAPARSNLALKRETPIREIKGTDATQLSPSIPEEDDDSTANDVTGDSKQVGEGTDEEPSVTPIQRNDRAVHTEPINRNAAIPSTSRGPISGSLESRAATQREIEQLKAKVRTLEGKRLEDRDKLKLTDGLKVDRDRFEKIIQTLQTKIKKSQHEMSELRQKYNEAEIRASQGEGQGAEHESEIEMAMLDKEMAEERAEAFGAELQALRSKHEELELEVEILREENRELGSGMNEEEKANAGWLQMERERERLRQALMMLRDMSQQTESDLRSQIKELREELEASEQTSANYQEISGKLERTESTNRHLMEQLEAAEASEEISLALELEKEQNAKQIEQLKEYVQSLQEEVQVNDEIEMYHIATEREMQEELDSRQAVLHEKDHRANEQDKVIEDLEYTLTKFRDVVSGLQSDIDDLRRSRDISDSEAHEMSSKSRAMLDLNLRLQTTAAKTQTKTVDIEMERIRADQSLQQLAIVEMFVHDAFAADRNPVLALLCFKRIQLKAALVCSTLRDTLKDRPGVYDDPYSLFDVIEKMSWISTCCKRFVQFLSDCSLPDFGRFQNAALELEPVERTMNTWIEALRQNELSSQGADYLSRMASVLSDMAEKLITENMESKAVELGVHADMTEACSDSIATQLGLIVKVVQSKLGPPIDDDGDAVDFDKKMDHFSTKARTIRYVASKASQNLRDLFSRSMCLDESKWTVFSITAQLAQDLCLVIRDLGANISHAFGEVDREESISYSSISALVTTSTRAIAERLDLHLDPAADGLTSLSSLIQLLQSKTEDMHTLSGDYTQALEFEPLPSPWSVRAKQIQQQKIASQDTQTQLHRLQSQAQEHLLTLSTKDKQLEEQQIRIELLQSRTQETKAHSETLQKLTAEAEGLRLEKEKLRRDYEQSTAEHQALVASHEKAQREIELLRTAQPVELGIPVAAKTDEPPSIRLTTDVQLLRTDILSLQAAVRHLKAENYRLRMPASTAALQAQEHAWLDPSTLQPQRMGRDQRSPRARDESSDVFARLLDIAVNAKPVVVRREATSTSVGDKEKPSSSWRPVRDTLRYQVLKQQEEMVQWQMWREDLVKRVKLQSRQAARPAAAAGAGVVGKPTSRGSRLPEKIALRLPKGKERRDPTAVEIVGSPPR